MESSVLYCKELTERLISIPNRNVSSGRIHVWYLSSQWRKHLKHFQRLIILYQAMLLAPDFTKLYVFLCNPNILHKVHLGVQRTCKFGAYLLFFQLKAADALSLPLLLKPCRAGWEGRACRASKVSRARLVPWEQLSYLRREVLLLGWKRQCSSLPSCDWHSQKRMAGTIWTQKTRRSCCPGLRWQKQLLSCLLSDGVWERASTESALWCQSV